MWRVGAVLAMLAAPASADTWFLHPFSELRSYHQDWLAVCDGAGLGACRAVHYVFAPGDDTFFGRARVAVHRTEPDGYAIELWDQTAAMTPPLPVTLYFDGAPVDLRQADVVVGGHDGINVAQTLSITQPALAQALAALMQQADRMDMTLGDTPRRVSLLGLTAALDAIDAHRRTRE